MVIATLYPFLGILWSTLIFFAWVILIWIAITVLIVSFAGTTSRAGPKQRGRSFVVILPWIGMLVYLIVNHQGMAERRVKEVQASQAQLDDYVRQTAGTGGSASEIEKAKQLLDNGTITEVEFDKLRAKALG